MSPLSDLALSFVLGRVESQILDQRLILVRIRIVGWRIWIPVIHVKRGFQQPVFMVIPASLMGKMGWGATGSPSRPVGKVSIMTFFLLF